MPTQFTVTAGCYAMPDNDASFIYWNWILDIWTKVHMPDELQNKYPKYRTLQEDVIPLLPKDIGWLDASMLTLIQTHWNFIQAGAIRPCAKD